jgi:hypothetical protein
MNSNARAIKRPAAFFRQPAASLFLADKGFYQPQRPMPKLDVKRMIKTMIPINHLSSRFMI